MIQKKVCILGATGVGKTSLIRQFVEGSFSEKYLTTIGVKIDKKQVDVDQTSTQLLIWDLEGIDRYCGFNPRYLRGTSAFFVVMDQTRSQSLIEGMEILHMARDHTAVPAIMIINKCDLDSAWHWDADSVNQRASEFDNCFYTSAKTGENVEQMFTEIARLSLG
ncbi:Rab family GTPase [Alteromonas sp. ASW11-36]|uniref:Rab family GTPase n=1 Tax=Alteromonas arenosi TaxID=3055817 RepID=A0ABT7SS86_9ALTE|nr:Rab family GTPase [Alteromonas sp. ASW11-36]MDM7859053.1 Rab family GTPase [Alteromonas sp. ASW11-36]